MKILHIAGGFAQHSLYSHLVQHLRSVCQRQSVFAAVRSTGELDRQPPDVPGAIVYEYRKILRPVHRLLFRTKIRAIVREVCQSFSPLDFTLIHAHTLYSDGAAALRLHKRFGVPYIVAVRNTDINIFMRFRPDLRWIAQAVLRGASRVVFLSPAYRMDFLSHLRGDLRAQIETKSVVVPNGLNSTWFESFSRAELEPDVPLRLLYVGNFGPNKNVRNTLRASAVLARRISVQLTLVGGDGIGDKQIRDAVSAGTYPFAKFYGRVDDEVELRSLYRKHDVFLMPSFKETFGVVYLEALSQGLPILHSRGQGVDGFFTPGTVSEAVDPNSIDEIVSGIEALAERMESLRSVCMHEARRFNWSSIAQEYGKLYRAIHSG